MMSRAEISVPATLTSIRSVRNWVARIAVEEGADSQLASDIKLCVDEAVTSEVTFKPLDEVTISSYVSLVHTLDKAGGYGIQEQSDLAAGQKRRAAESGARLKDIRKRQIRLVGH